ncbi:MAG TPA: biotin/lipoyl-binding protein [Chitinispirillaceae bacterium]|nr:biotin/lipoyl-binding protein [Chitinispirillaceae bacterium]
MKAFYGVCVCALVALTVITVSYRKEFTNFFGIADTKEKVISSEFGVEIKNVHMTPGQYVNAGDTLVELRSPEIDLKISEYKHLIDELKIRSKVETNLSKSEMRTLKTEHESRIIEIRSELQQLQSQYEINRQLMSQLRSINRDAIENVSDGNNPTEIRMKSLQKELVRLEELNSIMDDNLSSRISYGADPIKEQLKQYEDILRLYSEQKEKLVITAKNDGVVGAVFYRQGEMVSAFDSIATLHSKSPSFVQGYIHERLHSSIGLGQKVIVKSMTNKKDMVQGEVIGIGTRIVEYPVRLRKVPEVQMWGREVSVRIPPNSGFLLGEKVVISFEKTREEGSSALKDLFNSFLSRAESVQDSETVIPSSNLINIVYVDEEMSSVGIEASGAIYLDDIQKYCIVSDEHTDLFLMNRDGVIEKTVKIDGLDKMDDMEAITMDDSGYIYIASSQNPKKNGKLPDSRRLLVRLKRNGEEFVLDGKILLINILQDAMKSDSGVSWASLVKIDKDKRLPDVEGIAYKDDCLYIGFKDPLIGNKSAILKIDDIENVFESQNLKAENVHLWRLLSLKDKKNSVIYRISDLCFINDDLYILSRGKDESEHMGSLWVLFQNTKIPGMIYEIHDSKPEGLTYDKNGNRILITFDNGEKKASQFTTIEDVL